MNLKHIPKIPVFISILAISILLSISIIKDYIAHTNYSKYKRDLKEDVQDHRYQIHHLKNALRFCPLNAEYLFETGRYCIKNKPTAKDMKARKKSFEEAKGFFLQALLYKPTDGKNWAEYAWYIGHKGEVASADEYFNKATILAKTDSYVHKLYARWCTNQIKARFNLNDTSRFIEMYRSEYNLQEILQSYSRHTINKVTITTFLRKALMEWDNALSLGTHMDKSAYNSYADLNLLICDLDKAIHNYGRANNEIMTARCFFIKEDYGKTIKILGSIIQASGTTFLENTTEIKKLLIEVTQHDPKNHQSFYWLGEIYSRLKMTEKAKVNFNRAIELYPQHIEARLSMARLYILTGKINLAIKEYEAILSINPKHKETVNLLGTTIRDKYKNAEFMTK